MTLLLNLPMAKKTTTKLANRVTSVKTNRATHELGLVVMRVGIFCSFLALKLCGKYFKHEVDQVRVRGSENGEWRVSEGSHPSS
jgi:hypothetical protein